MFCMTHGHYLQIAGEGAVVRVSSHMVVLSNWQGTEHLLGVAGVIPAYDRLWVHQA